MNVGTLIAYSNIKHIAQASVNNKYAFPKGDFKASRSGIRTRAVNSPYCLAEYCPIYVIHFELKPIYISSSDRVIVVLNKGTQRHWVNRSFFSVRLILRRFLKVSEKQLSFRSAELKNGHPVICLLRLNRTLTETRLRQIGFSFRVPRP